MSDQANMTEGEQLQLICEALVSAFVSYAKLEQFLRFRFNRHLNQIASQDNDIDYVCFKLADRSYSEGWNDQLVLEAVNYIPNNEKLKKLPAQLGLHIVRSGSGNYQSTAGQQVADDTSDPILVIEDFKKDLEKIRADESWAPEVLEQELGVLRDWLTKVRAHSRALSPRQPDNANLAQSVLCELRLTDAIEEMLAILDEFEICLNCLLDPSEPSGAMDQTRNIQWFRRASRKVFTGLNRLGCLGSLNPEKFRSPSFESAGLYFLRLREDLNRFKVTDNRAIEEWQKTLTDESGVGACLNSVVIYLTEAALPSGNSISMIRGFLVDFEGFIERMVAAQKRLSPAREDSPIFSQREAARVQKACEETLDSLDIYQLNLELFYRWNHAATRGRTAPIDFRDLYGARRSFIDNLDMVRRRVAAFVR